jgi:RND family efflux transporter MFP subunit
VARIAPADDQAGAIPDTTEEDMASAWRFLLLGAALATAGCGDHAPKGPEVRSVRTMVVDPGPIDDDRRAVGEVRPRYESELGFRVSGKLVARMVDVGASVKKGDLLARLDEQDYRNRLKSAEADIVAAQAVLTEAQAAEGRLRHLLANGHTTRSNYDVAVKNLRSAEAKLEATRIALQMAKDQVGYAELRADFDGVVTSVNAESGQVVNVGQVIMRLARPDAKDAVFAIAEAVFQDRRAGGEPPEVVALLLSNPSVSAEGVVREISPIADPATRTFQVKVTLKDPPERMRFGGSVVGRVKTHTKPVVVLPGSALFDKGGRPAVWVVDAASSSVMLKPVTVARYETDRVVISDGLAQGDVAVTAGVNRLREKQKVRLAEGVSK